MKNLIVVLLSVQCFASYANEIESVLLHPLYNENFQCSEHAATELKALGDALGADCVIQKLITVDGREWPRTYINQGLQNADWLGWQKDVLAPISGKVLKTNLNGVVNIPCIMGKGIASYILLQGADGLMVILAHVDGIDVAEGDHVAAGQPIAKVGNNGFSRSPHIHIGAWKGQNPLQIRFDQRYMKN